MSYKMVRNIAEWLVGVMLIVGVVTAALNLTFAGFTPIFWFTIAILVIVLIICTEVSRIREFLEKKQ